MGKNNYQQKPNQQIVDLLIVNTVKPVLRGHPWDKE